jgi:hypothetical protein
MFNRVLELVVSSWFDQVEKQCKTNTKNIIHFDSRIKKLEEKPVVQPVIQPVVESEEINSLKESVLDLKCPNRLLTPWQLDSHSVILAFNSFERFSKVLTLDDTESID